MTTREEKDAENLQTIQHVVQLIGDKEDVTFKVSQHVGIHKPLGTPAVVPVLIFVSLSCLGSSIDSNDGPKATIALSFSLSWLGQQVFVCCL